MALPCGIPAETVPLGPEPPRAHAEFQNTFLDFARRTDFLEITTICLSFLPAAAIGYRFERPIEERLGKPRAIAISLAIGSVAMLLADRRPELRTHDDARPKDGLLIGVAQAAALAPGVSRNGATVAAARWLKFTRGEANELSRRVALPVIVGASALKAARLRRRGIDRKQAGILAVGFGAAFASTLASLKLIRRVERRRSLAPYALYRLALAATVVASERRRGSGYARYRDE